MIVSIDSMVMPFSYVGLSWEYLMGIKKYEDLYVDVDVDRDDSEKGNEMSRNAGLLDTRRVHQVTCECTTPVEVSFLSTI